MYFCLYLGTQRRDVCASVRYCVLTCESNLLAADGTPVLFLFVLAGILVVGVRVRGAGARAAGARSAFLFQFLKCYN